MFANSKSQDEVSHFLIAWCPLGDHIQLAFVDPPGVPVLHQKTACKRAQINAAGGWIRQATGHQQAQVFLFREDFASGCVSLRRDHDFA